MNGNTKRNLLLALASIALAVVLVVEGARMLPVMRALTPRIEADYFGLDGITTQDLNLFWRLHPNQTLTDLTIPDVPGRKWSMTTNAQGLRGQDIKAQKPGYRVLALGDSTTFGIGVDDDETWPALLQELLDPTGTTIDVINAGGHGATSIQGLTYLLTRGLELQPNVLIVTYQFNDCAEAPFNDLTELVRLKNKEGASTQLRDMVTKLDPTAANEPRRRKRLTEGEFLDAMIEIGALCRRRGISLVYLSWPTQPELNTGIPLSPYRALIKTAADITQYPMLDLLPVFQSAPEPPLLDIVHANELGCQLVASRLDAFLVEQKILPGRQ